MHEQLRGIKTGSREVVICLPEEPAKNYERITWFSSTLFFEVTKIYSDTTCKITYHVRISNIYILHMNKTFLDYLHEFPMCESYECKYCSQYIRCTMTSVSLTQILRGEY